MKDNRVTIQIENIESKIVEILPIPVIMDISSKTSYYIVGSQFSEYAKSGNWDGTKKLFSQKNQSFPTGLLNRVVTCLKTFGYDIVFDDRRVKPISKKPIKLKSVKLRDYQKEAVDTLKTKTRGILRGATAMGKSYVITSLLAELNCNTLVLTATSTVFNQLHNTIEKLTNKKIGKIGAGECNPKNITVGLMQSFISSEDCKKNKLVDGRWRKVDSKVITVRESLTDYLKGVECIIVDEAHHLSCDILQKIRLACPNAYYAYGFSATPFRDDKLDILIEAATGRVVCDYNASYMIRRGFISRPIINLVPFKQNRLPRKITYSKAYSDLITNNEERNNLIVSLAKKQVELNRSVLIPVRYIEHGTILERKLKQVYGDKVRFVNGTDSKTLLMETLVHLSNKDIMVCIATGVYNEGVDAVGLDCVIQGSSVSSSVIALQVVGRALRKTDTKSEAYIFDIQDYGCRWFSEHSQARLDIYRTEPEFIIKNCDFGEI